eukprot:2479787-Pyramimonas_sp.AAC.1
MARVKAAPTWAGGAMWSPPLAPLMELPGWQDTCEWRVEMSAWTPCGYPPWRHRSSSLGNGQETYERIAKVSAGTPL